MKKLLTVVFTLFTFYNLSAQSLETTLIEFNNGPDSFPKNLTKGINKIFFSATDEIHGRELWAHDLLTQETYMVKNVLSGNSDYSDWGNFTMAGDVLYFMAAEGFINGLYRSDGTEEGTYLIKDLSQNLTTWYNNDFKYANGKLLFVAHDDIHGYELWVSDGTEQGTHLLKDIAVGTNNGVMSAIYVFNNSFYFVANDGIHGSELWKSDGTEEGTFMLKDIRQNSTQQGAIDKMIITNNAFYFMANNGTSGFEIWKSDGTEQGTTFFEEIAPGPQGIFDFNGIAFNDGFIFTTTLENGDIKLLKSNGIPGGIINLKEDNTDYGQFNVMNNHVYFTTGSTFNVTKLWSTDGTAEGTQQILDVDDLSGNEITKLTAADNFLIFFSDNHSGYGTPWVSDGTTAGTHELADINISHSSAGELDFLPVNNLVFFQGNSGEKSGVELWQTDGTSNNTKIMAEVCHRYAGISIDQQASVILNGKLVFIGNNGESGNELFVSNGTNIGNDIIKDLVPGNSGMFDFIDSETRIFTKASEKIYFRGRNNDTGSEIYCSDGTFDGTHLVKDIAPGIANAIDEYTYFMEFNGIFYFKANDGVHGEELWRTDSTEEGTYMVKDISAGSGSGVSSSNIYTYIPRNFAVLNGLLYFVAYGPEGQAIWKTDGTEAGTIHAITVSGGATILGTANNKLIFSSNYLDSTYGDNTIWSSDGTQNGTVLLASYSDSESTQFMYNCTFNDELYFGVFDGANGRSLMKTDGTIEGTVLVKGNLPGGFSNFRYIDYCGNYLYFMIGEVLNNAGYELWRTDGTEEGTIIIADENTIPGYYYLNNLTCHDSLLYFLPGFGGNHLWVTDGSTSNTYPIEVTVTNGEQFEDLYGLSGIAAFTNDKIFLKGGTARGGNELYVSGYEELPLRVHETQMELSAKSNFILYPNPTNGNITINSTSNQIIQQIELYDFSGKKLLDKKINLSSAAINLSELSKGIYIIKIKGEKSSETKKIMRN